MRLLKISTGAHSDVENYVMQLFRFDEYQHTVGWDYDLLLLGGNRRFFVLAQGFLDLLFDFQQGYVQRGAWVVIFGKSGTWAVQPPAESVQSTGYGWFSTEMLYCIPNISSILSISCRLCSSMLWT